MTRIDNVETSANTEDMPIQLDVIPESLLSFAKDARYIQLCQQLLQQILEPWSRRHPSSSSSIQKDTWFLSSFLYVLLVVVPSGRTLGMEACGLTVAVGPKTTSTRLARVLLLSISGLYALDRWVTRTTTQTPSTNNRESLRGDERRQIHEQLRQQMMQRAGDASTTITTTTPIPSTSSSPTNPSQPSLYSQRLKSLLKACAKALVDAVVASPPEGPHGLSRDTNGATQSDFSMGMWLIRLHLAHYCITGKYPSWLYRFAGLKLERHSGDTLRIPSRPTTVRMVGVVIGVQAAATLFRHTANTLSRWMADRLEQNAAANNNNNIESRPSIFPTPTNKQVSSSTNKKSSTCAICRMPRSHPAAPSSCGHVCCWNCLMQWVSVVRPECPLCRSPCRPQDIICLYDYEQPIEE